MKETKTHDDYWDCECEHNYIQKKSDTLHCSKCNSHEDEQPDSRVNEVEEVIDCHSCGKTVPKQDSFCSDATYEQYVCSECNDAHYTEDISVFETKSKIPLANDGTDIEIVWWWSNGGGNIREELAELGFSSTYKYTDRISEYDSNREEIGHGWNSGTLTYPNYKNADQICAEECGVNTMQDYDPNHKYLEITKEEDQS